MASLAELRAVNVTCVEEVGILGESNPPANLLEEDEDMYDPGCIGRDSPGALGVPWCWSHGQRLFEVGLRDRLEEVLVHKLLPCGFEVQAGNTQLKFPHRNARCRAIVLIDHLSVVLESAIKFEEHGRQELVTEVFEEGKVVKGYQCFHRCASMSKATECSFACINVTTGCVRMVSSVKVRVDS